MFKRTVFTTLFFALFAFNAFTQDLEIRRMSPMGDNVESLRQISFTFDRNVVPLGKMERFSNEIPITITPKVECQWRWVSRTVLACQLDDKNRLKKATKYKVSVGKNIVAEDGDKLGQEYQYEFTTQKPQVNSYVNLVKWITPTKPSLRIGFNQDVQKASVLEHVYYESDGKRYGIEAVSQDYNRWLITPIKDLGLNANVRLMIEPGIESSEGDERSIESKELISFSTYDKPKLLKASCLKDADSYRLEELDNVSGKGEIACSPDRYVDMVFNVPIFNRDLYHHIVVLDSAGKRVKIFEAPTYERHQYHRVHRKNSTYRVRLPITLGAQETYQVSIVEEADIQRDVAQKSEALEVSKEPNILIRIWRWIKALFGFSEDTNNKNVAEAEIIFEKHDLTDIFSRKFDQGYQFIVKTGDFAPTYKMKYRDVILEKNIDSKNIIKAVNFNEMKASYESFTVDGRKEATHDIISSPMETNRRMNLPLGIRDMLHGKSGVVRGQITTSPNTCKRGNCGKFIAQITPYNILAKIGHFNSVVWVADLESGKPVANAKVSLHLGRSIIDLDEALSVAKADKFGVASLPGKTEFDPEGKIRYYPGGYNYKSLFIKVVKKDEIAILPLHYDFKTNMYRIAGFSSRPQMKNGHIKAWGTTAQGIYKKGEQVSYKIYVRDHGNKAIKLAKSGTYHLTVKDPFGKTVYEKKDVTLSEFATFAGDFKLADSAKSGWYQMHLRSDYTHYSWNPAKFLVTDFTPSPFKVSNALNGENFYQGSDVSVETFAKMHSGGPYANSPARIIAKIKEKRFVSNHALAKGFSFDSYNQYHNQETVFSKEDSVDDKGELVNVFNVNKSNIYYGTLSVESSVSDDRGKNIASTATANYFAVKRFVGLKSTKWVHKVKEKAEINYIVVDEKGEPVDGSDVDIRVEYEETKLAKIKSSGNSFVNRYDKTWQEVAKCGDTSSKSKALSCKFKPKKSGRYRLFATTKDVDGREHKTKLELWVTGRDWVTWEQPNDNSLVIIPKSTDYNVGQKARFLIKNPYPDAHALVTIERYGVIKQWVQKLEGNMPIVEFDVEADFLPGFYFSVTVMSKRSDGGFSGEGVDLGKPSFKMGYQKVIVNDPLKKIKVDIQTDQEIYRPKETVEVDVKAHTKTANPGKIELTAIVIDEAVFDMIQGGASYYDLHQGFNKLAGLDLENFNLMKKLIGRQKIEKKGANPGGGGMRKAMFAEASAKKNNDNIRNNFAYVAYFNPSIVTDAEGRAKFDFILPDNLTGWKLLILATNQTDLLGLSDKTITSTLPIEVRPIMPNQVREGDAFNAGFSVLNRTKTAKKVTLVIESIIKTDATELSKSTTKEVLVEPFKRKSVFIPINTSKSGHISFSALASSGIESDSLQHKVKILRNRSLQTAANYGSTTHEKVEETIKFPANIYGDIGKIDVTLAPTVIGNIDGSFEYMQKYPYKCWEQKLTKGTMASHYQSLSDYISKDVSWPESKELPQKTLDQAYGFQAPNGGMTYFKARNNFVSPYLSAYSALAFNWLTDAGYQVDQDVEKKLHTYLLRDVLRRDISETYYTRAMGHTVRSVVLNALSRHDTITKNDILNHKEHFNEMDLFGKANFLQAALQTSSNESWLKDLINNILSYSNQSAGKFTFSEEMDSGYKRILSSEVRTNCAILSSLVLAAKIPEYKKLIDDIPFKIVRMITDAKGNKYHFNSTQENMFCANALIEYSKVYEKQKPNMNLAVSFNKKALGNGVLHSFKDKPLNFKRPINDNDVAKKATVTINKKGEGRFYYTTKLTYASKEKATNRVNAGIDIRREYSVKKDGKWTLLKSADAIRRGELVKVDLFVSLPTARQFVVVDDAVISGLEPVNRDLATNSKNDADEAKELIPQNSWYFKRDNWQHFSFARWGFYHKELNHDNVRFYSDYVSGGNYHLSYIAQAIATGSFSVLPAHAQEMYDPDVYGKSLGFTLDIKDE